MRITASLAAVVVVVFGIAPAATAAPAAPVARPTITVITPDVLRVDKQNETNNVVVFAGMDAKSKARVNWGDGQPTQAARGTCKTATALAHPDWCSVAAVHEYSAPGTYTITAITGKQVVSKLVTISPAPVRWSPPAGYVPVGWSMLGSAATYFPCQTVNWYYDRTNQPAGASQIYNDTITGLQMLSTETGLAFVETADPNAADLLFRFANTGSAAGIGGGGFGRGTVTYSTTDWWPTDQWPGFGIVRQPNGTSAAGHGWLVVHEVMHAIGIGHVNDRTSVMNPVGGAIAFNAGDLEGLRTLYKNNPCPVG